jgi:hypothetical protein
MPDGAILLFADWEEIADSDTNSQFAWNQEVWHALNPGKLYRPPPVSLLQSEAGLGPETRVRVPSWLGGAATMAASEIEVGDAVLDADGRPTEVVGIVRLAGDQSTDVVLVPGGSIPGQTVTAATWIRLPNRVEWVQPGATPARPFFERTEMHMRSWVHIYTATGSLQLENGWGVRDASDVGLENLRPLVEGVVLGGGSNT